MFYLKKFRKKIKKTHSGGLEDFFDTHAKLVEVFHALCVVEEAASHRRELHQTGESIGGHLGRQMKVQIKKQLNIGKIHNDYRMI